MSIEKTLEVMEAARDHAASVTLGYSQLRHLIAYIEWLEGIEGRGSCIDGFERDKE
jgi:hypothetical protein